MDNIEKPTSNRVLSKTPPRNAETSIHLSFAVQHDGAITENDCSDYCGGMESGKAIKVEPGNSGNIDQEESSEVLTRRDSLEMEEQTMSGKIPFDCTETGLFFLLKNILFCFNAILLKCLVFKFSFSRKFMYLDVNFS